MKIRERDNGVTIECRVTPRAGKSRIKGVRDGVLMVALAAAPVDGAANEELIEFLSDELRIPKSRISIISGEKSRDKVVLIQGINTMNLLNSVDLKHYKAGSFK
ncbi:MAG: DUF167 domain-containing protein [bacterium]